MPSPLLQLCQIPLNNCSTHGICNYSAPTWDMQKILFWQSMQRLIQVWKRCIHTINKAIFKIHLKYNLEVSILWSLRSVYWISQSFVLNFKITYTLIYYSSMFRSTKLRLSESWFTNLWKKTMVSHFFNSVDFLRIWY